MDTTETISGIRSLAATAREKFSRGQRMVIRNSRVVHGVDRERWVAGELVPQPLCHTAVYGWSPDALAATWQPITCRKCLTRLPSARAAMFPYGDVQTALFPADLGKAA